MKRLAVPTLGLLILASVTNVEAKTCYVRFDGSDQYCTGLQDAAWSGSTDPNLPCAKSSIEGDPNDDIPPGADDECLASGDVIKVYSNAAEGVLYLEAPTINRSGLTIEGYGGSGRPRIGKLSEFADGWTFYVPQDIWQRSYTADNATGVIWGAYVDLVNADPYPRAYEHERMTLAVHQDPNDLMADPNALDPNTCPTSGTPPAYYYLGPGFNYDPNGSLYVRLKPTPEFDVYNTDYLYLGLSHNPNNSKILVSSSDYSLRVRDASNVTLKNLQLEAARGALTLNNAQSVTADNLVIWSGFGAAVRNDGGVSHDFMLKNSSILHDTPYWIAWSDCKNASGPCENQDPNSKSGGMRETMIEPDPNCLRWTLDHNLIRGGHDGLGSENGNKDFVVKYNVFADFHDDPIELEGVDVDRFDIYGNYFTNSLNCLAVGQPADSMDPNSTRIDGPIYYFSNICTLARVPFVDRFRKNDGACCYGTCSFDWSGGRRYGNEGAFKIGPSQQKVNTNIYQNTIFLTDSHPDSGLAFLGSDPNPMRDKEVFNNMFLKMNGRVGQSNYHASATNKLVNRDLYWKMNNDSNYLLASQNYVGTGTALCTGNPGDPNWECQALGGGPSQPYVGTNPVFHDQRTGATRQEGFGCFGSGSCDGIDETVTARWSIRPGSEFWEPELFIPRTTSPACGSGRGSIPAGWPTNHVVDPNATLRSQDIGAVGCDPLPTGWISLWNSFPFSKVWSSQNLASGSAPNGTITQPPWDKTVCPGVSVNFCGNKTDIDGAPPYTYLWDFDNTFGCPSDKTVLCPGNHTFWVGNVTCAVTFKVTDRWGNADPTPMTRVVDVIPECLSPSP